MENAQYMTATEKEKIAAQYRRFLKRLLSGYHEEIPDSGGDYNGTLTIAWNVFTDALYRHLHLHCGFIAHYNRRGFYYTYFVQPESTLSFLEHMARPMPYNEYDDLNENMMNATKDAMPFFRAMLTESAKDRDLALAAALRSKWGVQ